MCCLGFGCAHNTDYLGSVWMLGPGSDKLNYRCLDDDGTMRIDIDVLMVQGTKTATSKAQERTDMIFVPV